MKEYGNDLVIYRLQRAIHTLRVSRNLIDNRCYLDSINRSYYSAFYAINAVHALASVGYRKHKDAIANFNKEYVATGIIDRSIGRDLATLERARNIGDYDDFQLTSRDDACSNYNRAERIIEAAYSYCVEQGIDMLRIEIAKYVDIDMIQDFIDSVPKSMLKLDNIEILAKQFISSK